MKINQKVYALYVNLTNNYISFKIEKGKFLGKLKEKGYKNYYVVEHLDDEVNYLKVEDIFETEKEAMLHLIEIIKKKYDKK